MGACLLCCAALCCAVVDRTLGRRFLTKINANIGNSAVSSSIEEVRGFFE
jgi:thiamine biosynthesis protein ThiC